MNDRDSESDSDSPPVSRRRHQALNPGSRSDDDGSDSSEMTIVSYSDDKTWCADDSDGGSVESVRSKESSHYPDYEPEALSTDVRISS